MAGRWLLRGISVVISRDPMGPHPVIFPYEVSYGSSMGKWDSQHWQIGDP